MKAILAAAWATVLFFTSLPASATQPEWSAQSARVDYSDLDLSRAAGVSTLEHRVSAAIRQVCDGPAFDLREKLQQQACRRSTGAAGSRAIDDAIRTSKQSPSRNAAGTSPLGAADKASSSSRQQPWFRTDRIPQR